LANTFLETAEAEHYDTCQMWHFIQS